MRALIVGAGLGGLCLAHGLRRAGVGVAVFERRPLTAAPSSYGIHLDRHGLRALHACLPPENWAALVASTDPAPDVVRFRDPALRTLAVLDREQAGTADPVTRRRAVRRDALHRALLLGLDDVVRADTGYVSHRERPDGRVEAWFTGGNTAVGDLLVGADGADSRVRANRLPGLDRIDLDIVNIAGRVPLTTAAAATVPPDLVDGSVNNMVPTGRGWLFASTWRAADGRTDLVWAWVGDRGGYPDDVAERPGEQLRALVVDRLAGWAPGLRELVAATPPDTVSPISLRTMPPLPLWRPGRVTLLGDAVHAMTPMAGVGANTALRDAVELCRALTVEDAMASPVEHVGRYEARMRGYANAALARSTRNAHNAATTSRPARLAFRAVLRAARTFPPVERAVFGA